MKKIYTLVIVMICATYAHAQLRFYPSTYMRVLNATSNDTLINAYTGGLLCPIFSNIDLNNDGLKDLVVFDKWDNTFMTFLAVKKGSTKYVFSPQYEHAFPKTYGWIYMVDYNKDGLPDIFMHAGGYNENTGMRIYKNVSTKDSVKFKLLIDDVPVKTTSSGSVFYASRVEFPLFKDMDGDGDIDILNFDYFSTTTIRFIRNISVGTHPKDKHSLDSIGFKLQDECWGRFSEQTSDHSYFPITCGEELVDTPAIHPATHTGAARAHAGSALFAWDMDGDGDMDLAVSDVGFDSITILQNLRINGSTKRDHDTVVVNKLDRFFPANSSKVSLMDMPLASPVDIDNDGIDDIVIAPVGLDPAFNNTTWYYRNEPGANKIDQFNFKQNDFLDNTMLDWGGYAKPVFFDYNGDGRQDLMLAVLSDKNKKQYTHLVLYKNMSSTKGHPYFQLVTDDFLGLSTQNIFGMAPSVGDLDGDGIVDLVLGNIGGTVQFYKGSVANKIISFSSTPSTLNYKSNGKDSIINVGGNSAPAIGDVDGDGKNDLVIGNNGRTLRYFHYLSNQSGVPVFEFKTKNFGGIDLGSNAANSVPCIADIDRDGKPDLLLGASDGKVRIYSNIRQSGSFTKAVTPFYNYTSNTSMDSVFGSNTAVAVAKLDQDTMPDMIIGTVRGGVYLMCTTDNGYKEPSAGINEKYLIPASSLHIDVYPNPAMDEFTFRYSGNDIYMHGNIVVMDMLGRVIHQQPISMYPGDGAEKIDVSRLPAGVYFTALYNNGNVLVQATKIIVRK